MLSCRTQYRTRVIVGAPEGRLAHAVAWTLAFVGRTLATTEVGCGTDSMSVAGEFRYPQVVSRTYVAKSACASRELQLSQRTGKPREVRLGRRQLEAAVTVEAPATSATAKLAGRPASVRSWSPIPPNSSHLGTLAGRGPCRPGCRGRTPARHPAPSSPALFPPRAAPDRRPEPLDQRKRAMSMAGVPQVSPDRPRRSQPGPYAEAPRRRRLRSRRRRPPSRPRTCPRRPPRRP